RDFPTLAHVIRFARNGQPEPAAAPPAASPTREADPIQEKVLSIVAEKTGYPKDMLALDLDLEADLGIDTVKQAEMFAAVRAAYNIPRADDLKLRDFPTLAHVIRFARNGQPEPAAVPPAASPALATDAIQERVLAIVAEKTGYPKDMLALDLDLEADLGIDTVKQAEMFAAVRAAYNIPRADNLRLRDFPTLAHVIRFARNGQPEPAAAAATDPIQDEILAIVAEKTGYPKDMLALDLDLEADLGIDTVKQAEMFAAVRAAYNIPRADDLKLRDFPTLAHVIRFAQQGQTNVTPPAAPERPIAPPLDAVNLIPRRVPVPVLRPPLAVCKPTGVALGAGSRVAIKADRGGVAEALEGQLTAMGVEVIHLDDSPDADALAAGPIQGVYWLPALDHEVAIADMDLGAWHSALQARLKSLFTTMRALYGQVAEAGTFLVSATRLGGQHGYDEAGALAPLGGAVTGFTKAYKRERMDALVKAVDFGPECEAPELAQRLVDETLGDPGAVEIAYQGGLRWTIGLEERPVDAGLPGLTLDRNTVFLITGAAGSIVSAITADLAAASGGTFYLLDLVPEPDPANPDLDRFVNDKDGLKRDLFARIQARGERATPALVEKELAVLERAQAARSAIQAVRNAGGMAHYFSVNMTDPDAVAHAIAQVRERSGRIDVLLHAAGIERSHLLPDKDPREFDLVFDVKSDGWFNLLHAIGDMPLGATVAFSSIAGRFGNLGQTDYSAANDLLCKITSSFRTSRPATRGIAIDWTAWAGIGMATRGSIPKVMEQAGIDMLPPEAGIPLIRRELTAGGMRGELVAAQRLGVMAKDWDVTGGLDTSWEAAACGPMFGKPVSVSVQDGLTIETTLDPAVQPFLHDHQIEGSPVLPGVMGIEAFAEAAHWMLPDWHVHAIEDVNFLAPFKFYRNEPRTLTVQAVFSSQGDAVVADCRLIGRRTLANQAEPQVTTHFRARVRLTRQTSEAVAAPPPPVPGASVVEASDIYRAYFHGPAYKVLERAWRDGDRVIGLMAADLPANHLPSDRPTLMAPRLIELCFQTAGLWDLGLHRRMGLPRHLDRVSLVHTPEPGEGRLYAVVTPVEGGGFDAAIVGASGHCCLRVDGYQTVEFPTAGIDGAALDALHAVIDEPAGLAVHA
ncbi:MAG TPA: SDR family NAD(P)-dependent oxidoreductase, partial [Bryobacteraceae bacterium]